LSGVVDICFPLFDQFGVVASLNIVYLNQRDARVTVPAARAALQKVAEGISRSLGWLPRS
jgi:DNA-binding IclR family transcriptional regulator